MYFNLAYIYIYIQLNTSNQQETVKELLHFFFILFIEKPHPYWRLHTIWTLFAPLCAIPLAIPLHRICIGVVYSRITFKRVCRLFQLKPRAYIYSERLLPSCTRTQCEHLPSRSVKAPLPTNFRFILK